MDPTQPSKTEEERIRTQDQALEKKTVSSPTERMEEMTTRQTTPTGETVKATKTAGVSPEYAKEYERKKTIFHTYRVVWYVLGFIEIILAVRFALKALGANPQSGFADFIYGITYPFAQPFIDLFSPSTGTGAETLSIVEWSTLIAMLVYVFIAWGIEELLRFVKPIHPEEVERTVEGQ